MRQDGVSGGPGPVSRGPGKGPPAPRGLVVCDAIADAPDAWRETWRRARKRHTCCACREAIRPGDRYHYSSGIWDGSPGHFKHCARCWEVFLLISNDADDPVDLLLDCGSTWPEVFGTAQPAHLAFMTADEAQELGQ